MNPTQCHLRSLVRMHEALPTPTLTALSADGERDMLVRLAADVILAYREGQSFPQLGLR